MPSETEELKRIIRKVMSFVEEEKHSHITPEHLAYVLMDEEKVLSLCSGVNINPLDIKNDLRPLLDTVDKFDVPSNIIPTVAYMRILARSNTLANLRAASADATYLLLSIFEEDNDCYAKYVLSKHHITEKFIKENLKFDKKSGGALENYSVELVGLARSGKIDGLVGRKSEIESVIRILSRRKNSCPLLVGENGTGKTAIAEGFALKIANGEVPSSCKDYSVYAIDLSAMIAGTKFRGEFEERLTNVIKELSNDKNAIGFIDEIHTIVGAGSGSDSSLDAGNIIKPYLSNGSVRLIGSTTYDEYKNHILKDKALSRRFKKIDVSEPSSEETLEIIKGLRNTYEQYHGIKYTDEVLEKLVSLSGKYVIDRNFPDKAIDVMDEIGSKYHSKLYDGDAATISDVEEVICKMANLPAVSTGDSEKERLMTLATRVKDNLYGQDHVVDELYQKIKVAKAGFRDPNKPLVTGLLVGVSGCVTSDAKIKIRKVGKGFTPVKTVLDK